MDTERVERDEAGVKIKELIQKLRMDIEEMEAIMRTIDDRHILYRTRAVQRAQFLLLSDGSSKSKINNILRFYASTIDSKEDGYKHLDDKHKNLMIQLNLADEYYKMVEKKEDVEKELEKRDKELFELKHELISIKEEERGKKHK